MEFTILEKEKKKKKTRRNNKKKIIIKYFKITLIFQSYFFMHIDIVFDESRIRKNVFNCTFPI